MKKANESLLETYKVRKETQLERLPLLCPVQPLKTCLLSIEVFGNKSKTKCIKCTFFMLAIFEILKFSA